MNLAPAAALFIVTLASAAAALAQAPEPTPDPRKAHEQARRQRLERIEKVAAERKAAWEKLEAAAAADGVQIACPGLPRWVLYRGYAVLADTERPWTAAFRYRLDGEKAIWTDEGGTRLELGLENWTMRTLRPGAQPREGLACERSGGDPAEIRGTPPEMPVIR